MSGEVVTQGLQVARPCREAHTLEIVVDEFIIATGGCLGRVGQHPQ